MKVIHVVRQFSPAIGGLENFILDLAIAQKQQGYQVSVVTLDRRYDTNEKLASAEVVQGIEVVRIPFVGHKKYPIAFSVLKHIKSADIVHVHAIDFFVDYLALTQFIHKKPLVVSTHGGFFHTKWAENFKKLYFRTITKASLSQARQVVSCSANDQSLFSQLYPSKTLLIENGINTTKFYSGPAEHCQKQMLFVGRFSDNKRIDLLIEWFAKLNQLDSEFRLVIAGVDWDNNYAALTKLVVQLDLADHIDFVLEASEEELNQIVEQSSFVVSASEYEGFGMTIIECMAGGLIPLMSDIKSFQQIHASSECGWIIDFAAKDSAQQWLSQWNTIQEPLALKQQCIDAAQRYSWPKVAQQFSHVYQQVMTTGSGHAPKAI